MTPEQQTNLRQWITALRSGEYKQGRKWLKRGGRYCCLGVAATLDPKVKVEGERFFFTEQSRQEREEVNPKWFRDRFGLVVDFTKDDRDKLIEMNDNEGKSFLEIADHLETFLPDPVTEAP